MICSFYLFCTKLPQYPASLIQLIQEPSILTSLGMAKELNVFLNEAHGDVGEDYNDDD